MRIQNKVKKAVETLEYFTSHQWEFTNDNLFMLMKEMNEYDAKVIVKILLKNYDSEILNLHVRHLIWM